MKPTPTATNRTGTRQRQRGLTLLELLMVIALMSAVGFMALSQVTDDMNQARYNDTRNRLEMIRRAIIGDTSRTINGQPEVRGFVADMGRLPNNLEELVDSPTACGTGDCEYQSYSDASGIWAGWNGPYLVANVETDGTSVTKVFRDGWGNKQSDSTTDAEQFGWLVEPASPNSAGYLKIQSYGLDNASGQLTENEHERDYPADGNLIDSNDYRIEVTSLPVQFGSSTPGGTCSFGSEACAAKHGNWSGSTCGFDSDTCPAAGGTWDTTASSCSFGEAACEAAGASWTSASVTLILCARIFTPTDGQMPAIASALVSTSTTLTISDGEPVFGSFAFADDTYITQGIRAIGIYLYDYDSDICQTDLYPTTVTSPRPYTFVARTPLQPVFWPLR